VLFIGGRFCSQRLGSWAGSTPGGSFKTTFQLVQFRSSSLISFRLAGSGSPGKLRRWLNRSRSVRLHTVLSIVQVDDGEKHRGENDVRFGVTGVAPHCPFGPIALAASLHLDAAIPNFLIQEQTAMGDGMLVTPFREISATHLRSEQLDPQQVTLLTDLSTRCRRRWIHFS
jgi:hypothetical protein